MGSDARAAFKRNVEKVAEYTVDGMKCFANWQVLLLAVASTSTTPSQFVWPDELIFFLEESDELNSWTRRQREALLVLSGG
jgi:hypothetical protein